MQVSWQMSNEIGMYIHTHTYVATLLMQGFELQLDGCNFQQPTMWQLNHRYICLPMPLLLACGSCNAVSFPFSSHLIRLFLAPDCHTLYTTVSYLPTCEGEEGQQHTYRSMPNRYYTRTFAAADAIPFHTAGCWQYTGVCVVCHDDCCRHK